MAGIGLQWAAGNLGAQDALDKIIASRKMDELLKQKQAQQAFENAMKSREIGSLESLRAAQAQPDPRVVRPFQMNPGDELFMPGQGVLHTVPLVPKEPAALPDLDRIRAEAEARAAGTRAGNPPKVADDISAQLREIQLQAAKDKLESGQLATKTAQETRERQRQGTLKQVSTTLGEVDRLLTPTGELTPAARAIVGGSRLMFRQAVPGSPELNTQASLDRIKSRLVTDLMQEMKQQSRTGATGFGQLSERELDLLERASSRLTPWQSEEAFKQALLEVKGLMQKSLDEANAAGQGRIAPAKPQPSPETGVVRRYNPATGKVE
jgi:hypothetical protein